MTIKLTIKRIIILCLILAAAFAIVAAVSAAASVVITANVLDARWEEQHNQMLNAALERQESILNARHQMELVIALEKQEDKLNAECQVALKEQKDELEAECKTALEQQQGKHRVELGQQRLKWLEKVWIMYYNTCMVLVGQQDTCLKSARNGYGEGAHDMTPAPGWDFYYVQFGPLDSG